MINWNQIKNFSKSEFVDDVNLADPKLIHSLDSARTLLAQRIFPSPVKGSLARFGSSQTSQHYVGPSPRMLLTRQATGIDVFIEGQPINNLQALMRSGLFNGIGVYLDTKGPDGLPWIMFHLDIRRRPAFWFATKFSDEPTKYRYPFAESRWWALMQDERLYEFRTKK